MEKKKKIITILVFINAVLLCCIGIQIAAAVGDSGNGVASSVGSMLKREVELADSRDGHVVSDFPVIAIQMEGSAVAYEFRYSVYGYPGYSREDFGEVLYESTANY